MQNSIDFLEKWTKTRITIKPYFLGELAYVVPEFYNSFFMDASIFFFYNSSFWNRKNLRIFFFLLRGEKHVFHHNIKLIL